MSRIWAIAKRELGSYFVSPIAYITVSVFIIVSSIFFLINVFPPPPNVSYADIRRVTASMITIFIFISPMLTMRLLSEERKLGTIELLYTSPVSLTQVVVGKYLASLLLFSILFVITMQFSFIVMIFGKPDIGPMFTCMLGFYLFAATCLAIGTFASSLSENQLVSAIIGLGLIMAFWLVGFLGNSIGGGVGGFFSSLSLLEHIDEFVLGVVDLGNVFYYVAMTGFFLFLTIRRLEWKRW